MATWRCPHCGTVQADGPRCFLCERSATSCSTCVNFRQSVVGGLGYCALDKRREALSGGERRSCWMGAPEASVVPETELQGPMIGLLDILDAAGELQPRLGAVRPVSGR